MAATARLSVFGVFVCVAMLGWSQRQNAAQPEVPAQAPYDPATDPSGMYSFLKDGEFVQLTLQDGELSGFISRFGESESDKGEFIDQFFDKASLQGEHISFHTKTVHGLWYAFQGTLTRQPGKTLGQEGYRIMRGTLTQQATDANGQERSSERRVELKSFPQDMSRP